MDAAAASAFKLNTSAVARWNEFRFRAKFVTVGLWRAHKSRVVSLVWMKGPEKILSASTDGTVLIWLPNGGLLGMLTPRETVYWDLNDPASYFCNKGLTSGNAAGRADYPAAGQAMSVKQEKNLVQDEKEKERERAELNQANGEVGSRAGRWKALKKSHLPTNTLRFSIEAAPFPLPAYTSSYIVPDRRAKSGGVAPSLADDFEEIEGPAGAPADYSCRTTAAPALSASQRALAYQRRARAKRLRAQATASHPNPNNARGTHADARLHAGSCAHHREEAASDLQACSLARRAYT